MSCGTCVKRRVFCLTESDIGDPIESSMLSAVLPGCHVPQSLQGEVVDMASELARISPKELATTGDRSNDIRMFKKSGLSITVHCPVRRQEARSTQLHLASLEPDSVSKDPTKKVKLPKTLFRSIRTTIKHHCKGRRFIPESIEIQNGLLMLWMVSRL